MPYTAIETLPDKIHKLPKHAQEIYLKAFNNAWKEYAAASKRRDASREVTAHKVAWNAVKHSYEKNGEVWVRK